jgi:hypothetical protein
MVQRQTTDNDSKSFKQYITDSDSPAGFGLGASANATSTGAVCAVELPERLFRTLQKNVRMFQKKIKGGCIEYKKVVGYKTSY